MQMRNHKSIIFGLIFGAAILVLLGAKITTNRLQIGNNTAEDIDIEFEKGNGTTNPRFRWNDTTGAITFTNDGTNFFDVGSGAGGGGGGINVLTNPGFESGTTAWTASGGSFTTTTAGAEVGAGGQSGKWDPSATAQTLEGDIQAIPNILQENSCLVQLSYLWDSGVAGDINLRVNDGTNDLTQPLDLTQTSGVWTKAFIAFPCPASGNFKLVLTSTADAAEITLDETHLGSAINETLLSSSGQLIAHAEYQTTTNCDWSRTSTTLGAFTADSDCPAITVLESSIDVDTTDNDLPDIDFDDLSAGTYKITASFTGVVVANANYQFAINDGTNSRGRQMVSPAQPTCTTDVCRIGFTIVAVFDHAGGPANFAIFTSSSASSVTINNSGFGAGADAITVLTVERLVGQQPAISLETQGWYIDANIGGANPSLGSTTQASYVQISNGSLDLVNNPGSAQAQISCDGAAAEGLDCDTAAVNELIGIAFTPPRQGVYRACFAFSYNQVNDTSNRARTTFQLVETADNSSAIVTEGGERIQHYSVQGVAEVLDSALGMQLCGIFRFSAVSIKQIKLYYEQSVAGTPTANEIVADRGVSFGQRDIHVTVYPLTQNFPQAVAEPVVSETTFTATEQTKVTWTGTGVFTNEKCIRVHTIVRCTLDISGYTFGNTANRHALFLDVVGLPTILPATITGIAVVGDSTSNRRSVLGIANVGATAIAIEGDIGTNTSSASAAFDNVSFTYETSDP